MLKIPRIMLAALRGGAGKTLLTIGIIAALRKRGLSVAAFKKGPDYIDAGWLGKAAQSECYNLDPYLFDNETLTNSFVSKSTDNDISVIEGNRGLFDGVSASGAYSSAELAKLLKTPVVLIVDASKMTRTAAALVLGCKSLDADVSLKGVILNRVAGSRHENTLRDSIETYCSIPVIGAVNKMSMDNFPQRHLGLLPLFEHSGAAALIDEAADVAESHIDLDTLLALANATPPLDSTNFGKPEQDLERDFANLRIGVLRDSAFQFYYPENLEALRSTGAQIVEVTALKAEPIPDLDALYIGGGFPETHAERLAKNTVFKESLNNAVESGLPVYAECGGLMYLARELIIDHSVYPMVGVFNVSAVLERKPQGHGYMTVEVAAPNPFFPIGLVLKGHEFHYSYICSETLDCNSYAFKVTRGHGITGMSDGIFRHNALGTYLHLHALGAPEWAKAILRLALDHHKKLAKKKNQ